MRYIMEKGKLKQISKAHGELFCSAPVCLVRESKKIEVDDEVESRISNSRRYRIYHACCFDAMWVGDGRLWAIMRTFYHVIGLAAVFGCAVSAMVITILLLLSGSGSVVILEKNQFVLVLEVVFCFIGATYAFRLMCRMVRRARRSRNEAQRVR